MRRIETLAADAATLQAYLRAIATFPRLTAEQEGELARRAQQLGDADALRTLVEANLRFVVSYAKRYRHLGVPFLDLIHEGNLGLIEGARRFDPDRHVKLITYAVWWIRQAIMHLLSDSMHSYALPPKVSSAAARFGRQVASLQAQLQHVPTTQEIAEELEIAEADALTFLQLQREDVSLSDPLRTRRGWGEGVEIGDTLPDPSATSVDDDLTRAALVEDLQRALADLGVRERQVMQWRYGFPGGEPRTLQQIGDRLHVSRERVRQIEAGAMQKLRRRTGLRSHLN